MLEESPHALPDEAAAADWGGALDGADAALAAPLAAVLLLLLHAAAASSPAAPACFTGAATTAANAMGAASSSLGALAAGSAALAGAPLRLGKSLRLPVTGAGAALAAPVHALKPRLAAGFSPRRLSAAPASLAAALVGAPAEPLAALAVGVRGVTTFPAPPRLAGHSGTPPFARSLVVLEEPPSEDRAVCPQALARRAGACAAPDAADGSDATEEEDGSFASEIASLDRRLSALLSDAALPPPPAVPPSAAPCVAPRLPLDFLLGTTIHESASPPSCLWSAAGAAPSAADDAADTDDGTGGEAVRVLAAAASDDAGLAAAAPVASDGALDAACASLDGGGDGASATPV